MHLVEAGPRHIRLQEGQGTFIDSLGFAFYDTRVLVEVDEQGAMTGVPLSTSLR